MNLFLSAQAEGATGSAAKTVVDRRGSVLRTALEQAGQPSSALGLSRGGYVLVRLTRVLHIPVRLPLRCACYRFFRGCTKRPPISPSLQDGRRIKGDWSPLNAADNYMVTAIIWEYIYRDSGHIPHVLVGSSPVGIVFVPACLRPLLLDGDRYTDSAIAALSEKPSLIVITAGRGCR